MPKIRDIMTTDVHTVTMDDNIYEVAVKMKEYDVGAIPVMRGDHIVGIITDRDIVIRGIANKKTGSATPQEVMTNDLVTGSPEMSVQEAADLMAEHQIRRIPIVENGVLIGIVALKDITDQTHSPHIASKAISEISEDDARHMRELH